MGTAKLALGVALNTAIIYVFLIVLLPDSRRRTLAQLSSMDLVVLILLGSAVETSMVQASTRLVCGFVSATTLLVVNALFSAAMRRSRRLRHLLGGGSTLIVHNGHMIVDRMRRAGLTEEDVRAALRGREISDIEDVRFAVLEPDGRINVVAKSDSPGSA